MVSMPKDRRNIFVHYTWGHSGTPAFRPPPEGYSPGCPIRGNFYVTVYEALDWRQANPDVQHIRPLGGFEVRAKLGEVVDPLFVLRKVDEGIEKLLEKTYTPKVRKD